MILETAHNIWPKYTLGPPYVPQDLLEVRSVRKRREEAEAHTTSTSDPRGKENKVVTTLPLDSQQPTSLAEGTSVIDSSTTHSPNSTYGTPSLVMDKIISSNLQEASSLEQAPAVLSHIQLAVSDI